jgi:EAL domain-containing protein (putative c-di-GMP-specific phosphodiesterase class I)/GGDEF domain-containing protein
MGFRLRLASLFVAVLAIVQALTALLVYEVTRREVIAEGTRQLTEAAGTFVRQLDDVSERVAESVRVLALDFALRSAIAEHDHGTVLSVLRNHGRRVGAGRMFLINLDRTIESDIADPSLEGRPFPYPDLLDKALEQPAASVVALGANAYWMVVVPVLAPVPIGFIAAGIPIDDQLLARMQGASALPKAIELVTSTGTGPWSVVARGVAPVSLAASLLGSARALPGAPAMVDVDDRDYVALAVRLDESERGSPMAAVLGYSLDDALRPYRRVAYAWAILLAVGLVFGLIGAAVIARGVSRPIEALAANAQRIEGGDYTPPPRLERNDEIGHLSAAFASMARAIGEREERIRFQADHDIATGLPNRLAADRAIDQSLSSNAGGALLAVGMARLPEIVKTMGHGIADRLMRHAAECVSRTAGGAGVARIGDTVLSVWMEGADQNGAITLAFRILDGLREPYREADLAIDAAPAVGIALHPQHGPKAELLAQRAEVALFAALGSEEPVIVYDPATDPHRPERLSLMGDLLQAIEHDQLRLFFQPKVNLANRAIDSVEALVRWPHPVRGLVPPDAFIGLAEETGNIRPLTRWVLATGAAQGREWAARGWNMRIAVNVSVRDLGDATLPDRIDQLLAVHHIQPERLMLEITESAVMGEPDAAIRVLKRLAERGIDLAIDDFGVGQSSFAYLRRLPVRELKIDQTFIRRLAEDEEDQTIVRSIVELGHRLGYRVTAEGVEDERAFEFLGRIGCDHAQGYFISKPVATGDFDAFIAAGRYPVAAYGMEAV